MHLYSAWYFKDIIDNSLRGKRVKMKNWFAECTSGEVYSFCSPTHICLFIWVMGDWKKEQRNGILIRKYASHNCSLLWFNISNYININICVGARCSAANIHQSISNYCTRRYHVSCHLSNMLHLNYCCRGPSRIQSIKMSTWPFTSLPPPHTPTPQMERLGRALDYDLQRALCPLSREHCPQWWSGWLGSVVQSPRVRPSAGGWVIGSPEVSQTAGTVSDFVARSALQLWPSSQRYYSISFPNTALINTFPVVISTSRPVRWQHLVKSLIS